MKMIESPALLKIFSKIWDEDFKHSKLTYYLHKKYFPFIESKIGQGHSREYSVEDVIAMTIIIMIIRKIGGDSLGHENGTSNFIYRNIKDISNGDVAILMFGGSGDPTLAIGEKDVKEALMRDLLEKPIPGKASFEGGIVSLSSKKSFEGKHLKKINEFVIFPVSKIAHNVRTLFEEV